MSNVSGINGSNYYPVDGTSGTPFMSSDALLEYCQMQLGGLDGEVDNQMKSQEMQLREREAVESAEQLINSFGTDGPQNAQQFQQCLQAIDKACASLPPGDPVAAQLQSYKQGLITKYQYTPPRGDPLTPDQQKELDQAQQIVSQGSGDPSKVEQAQVIVNGYGPVGYGVLGKQPEKGSKEWQEDMDALSNIADDVKSNAEIQMLKLQDLVSQRQQAVQLVSGMMSKTDQTLEDLAKAIGH